MQSLELDHQYRSTAYDNTTAHTKDTSAGKPQVGMCHDGSHSYQSHNTTSSSLGSPFRLGSGAGHYVWLLSLIHI